MVPAKKGKAGGTSASSFFDLKAVLSKREEEFSRNKTLGITTSTVGGAKRPDKKPTVWARQNKGVHSRGARDIELEAVSKPTLESARAALERKAKIYDKLRKGKTGGLNDKQYDMLLVDFDQKNGDVYESDSDDVDESLVVPVGPADGQDDPIVEYEDEFGRIRTGRRSEVPRHLVPPSEGDGIADDDSDVIYNPVNHFPVYEPSAERVAEIAEAHSEANNPLGVHYDASQEVRAKGAGFYQFSADEETRRQQMEELKAAREETEKTREETGAVTLKPGEVEGMRDEGDGSVAAAGVRSRAMEKRKLELEERRRMVDAKRRKTKGGGAQAVPSAAAALPAFEASPDPFAALEAQAVDGKGEEKSKFKGNAVTEADAFLAELDGILGGKRE